MKKTTLLLILLLALLTAGDWAWMSTATAQPGGGRGYAAQRERLVTELQLDSAQQARLDAITAEMLPRFLALRGLSAAERAPARAKLTLEVQQKINTMLTPDQRASYELIQARKAAGDVAGPPAAARSAASAAAGS